MSRVERFALVAAACLTLTLTVTACGSASPTSSTPSTTPSAARTTGTTGATDAPATTPGGTTKSGAPTSAPDKAPSGGPIAIEAAGGAVRNDSGGTTQFSFRKAADLTVTTSTSPVALALEPLTEGQQPISFTSVGGDGWDCEVAATTVGCTGSSDHPIQVTVTGEGGGGYATLSVNAGGDQYQVRLKYDTST
ncbi:hypothetical protein [Actinosynnema sp. NPDC020468]|uniref:hypothetical protein n=1 Tax=Actinosynnema sp. NPDC020468 TaxID=3154488 RepID=UPI0033FE2015